MAAQVVLWLSNFVLITVNTTEADTVWSGRNETLSVCVRVLVSLRNRTTVSLTAQSEERRLEKNRDYTAKMFLISVFFSLIETSTFGRRCRKRLDILRLKIKLQNLYRHLCSPHNISLITLVTTCLLFQCCICWLFQHGVRDHQNKYNESHVEHEYDKFI